MIAVLVGQFLSAMADNALLFGALALLRMDRYPAWTDPLLQEFFVGAYVLLAPCVGPFADALPKGRVMLVTNGLKLLGALGMWAGVNPFLAYGLVGIGAAAYSPAKYGILSELVPATLLVKANGLIESSSIAAIVVGAIAGGALADWNIRYGLAIVTACYAVAVATNLLIPCLPRAHPLARVSLGEILRDFGHALKVLIRIPDARFAMTGTSLFWGTGSTLRFMLVAWVPVALGITNNRMPAYLNATVAVGIVIGAGLASKLVALDRADRVLPAGVLIGVGVCILAATTHVATAFVVMTLVGVCGGYFLVPLNALIQDRGHRSVGAGHAIAIQNLVDNAAMVLMIGLYTLAARAGIPIVHIGAVFGACLTMAIGLLWLNRARSRVRTEVLAKQAADPYT
jgi:LPLT family lysophospholipid transporter-like MFS transporter